MRVIRRAAALAYAFVSVNYEQAIAIKDVVRSPLPRHEGRYRADLGLRPQRGGSIMKSLLLMLGTVGVVAFAGAPSTGALAPAMADGWRAIVASVSVVPSTVLDGSVTAVARWSEPGSLLLLAAGFFGAALWLGRKAR